MARGTATGSVKLKDYHTKTETAYIYVCTVYDPSKKEFKEGVNYPLEKKIPPEKFKKQINKKEGLVILDITSVETVKTLYGVSNEVWESNKVNLTEMMRKDKK